MQAPAIGLVGEESSIEIEQGDRGAVDTAPGGEVVDRLDIPVAGYSSVEVGLQEQELAAKGRNRVNLDIVDGDPPVPAGCEVADAEFYFFLVGRRLAEVDV